MAITLTDFAKIWASTSPLTPYSFSESNYKEGWNFIGGTPPSRQMWDSIQNQNDEKLKYIVDNFLPLDGGTMTGAIVLADGGNPLSTAGGTMDGAISFDETGQIGYRATTHTEPADPCKQLIVSSTDIDHWADEGGAKISLHTYDTTQTNTAEDGAFGLLATDGTNSKELKGKPNGNLTWAGKKVSTSNWKIEDVTLSLSGASIKSWGFCHIAYNENVAILSISGLAVGSTISQDTVLCYLPVSSLMSVYAPMHNMSNGSTISHAVITNNYVNINAVSNTTDAHAFSIVFPIA